MTRADIVVSESSHVGRARLMAEAAARRRGFPAQRVSLAASELASNLVKHAGHGLFGVMETPGGLDLYAVDTGPGIGRVSESMRDGFSTTGTLGGGLGAVRRAADFFDVYSRPGQGTAVLARWRSEPVTGPRIGAALFTAPGETESGDMWTAVRSENAYTIVLSDGLGHGERAAEASRGAIEAVARSAEWGPRRILETMHTRIAHTRGATVAVAEIRPADGKVQFGGVGNIACRLYATPSGHATRLVSRPGIVGAPGANRARESTVGWSSRSWLLMHSDGVSDRWTANSWPGLFDHDPATVAAWVLGQCGRGRDDACVVAVAQ
ncbi:SpoIIE family protein phosphatase [Amycolatopsis pigmentata]|uniref:SpoIIE family protein phosphatase n=1 Tax=Amycolatopsis pigmentata TaxID=450801 RepID=A0ABW5G4X5_9PSEU